MRANFLSHGPIGAVAEAQRKSGRRPINGERAGVRRRPFEKNGLLDVRRNVLVHLEHADALFAEDLLQLGVSVDLALVLAVLQAVLLDILPQLADDLAAGHRARTDDRSQVG